MSAVKTTSQESDEDEDVQSRNYGRYYVKIGRTDVLGLVWSGDLQNLQLN